MEPLMEELRVQVAANEATMRAVQETLHRIDRSIDKTSNATEQLMTSLAVQNQRADGADLRMLSFRESLETHTRDDVSAFRRIDEKFDGIKDKLDEQTKILSTRIEELSKFKLKWQGAGLTLVTLIGWAVVIFGHKAW